MTSQEARRVQLTSAEGQYLLDVLEARLDDAEPAEQDGAQKPANEPRPSLSCVEALRVILLAGGRPVDVDVDVEVGVIDEWIAILDGHLDDLTESDASRVVRSALRKLKRVRQLTPTLITEIE
jgi:hypothetical protein